MYYYISEFKNLGNFQLALSLIKFMTCFYILICYSTGCHKVGQFLPVTSGYGHDGCKYLVCTYGNEPWQDGYGNYKYYTEEQECSYGSFIPEYHSFDGYSNSNPCVGSGYEKYQCSKPGIFVHSQMKFTLNHGMTQGST